MVWYPRKTWQNMMWFPMKTCQYMLWYPSKTWQNMMWFPRKLGKTWCDTQEKHGVIPKGNSTKTNLRAALYGVARQQKLIIIIYK
jgi:hypothetical protein